MVVLPQPDSPTRLNVSPAFTVNETSDTACTLATRRCRIAPDVTGNSLTRLRTSSRGVPGGGVPGRGVPGGAVPRGGGGPGEGRSWRGRPRRRGSRPGHGVRARPGRAVGDGLRAGGVAIRRPV